MKPAKCGKESAVGPHCWVNPENVAFPPGDEGRRTKSPRGGGSAVTKSAQVGARSPGVLL